MVTFQRQGVRYNHSIFYLMITQDDALPFNQLKGDWNRQTYLKGCWMAYLYNLVTFPDHSVDQMAEFHPVLKHELDFISLSISVYLIRVENWFWKVKVTPNKF